MNRLSRYIGRQVILGALMALLVIVALDAVFSFINESGDVGQGGYTSLMALVYVLLQVPRSAYEMFPVATLVGALVALGGLAARSELTAMRAAGLSIGGITRAVVITGLLLAVGAVALGEWAAPAASRLGQDLRARSIGGGSAGIGDGGLWLRDGSRYIHVARVREQTQVEGVRVYRIANGRLTRIVTAERGRYKDGRWLLSGVEVTRIGADGVRVSRPDGRVLEAELNPELLGLVALPPELLPLPELYRYIDYRTRNGLDTVRYRLAFWVKLATPLATMVMLLLAVPLVLYVRPRAGSGQQIVVGVLVGTAFMLLNRLLNQAGVIYGFPPVLSAMAPSLIFMVLAVAGLQRLR
ncbi:LPS export ABC transporter permease LptG [Arhodomonas aquaeolei]|uniref:LPS export ABC transporter permease LptG n=1 Tax=Arhodomonas aquaeolei TaxID=2369 RepID=UPI000365D2CF|nr:LPS export ABC transporter permease LptG [Arhodomonas aquaeolei]